MFSSKIRALVQRQWAGLIALFLVLSGGSAYALDGSNTVFSDDIVNGEVKNPDVASNAIGSGKIIDGTIQSADIGANSVREPNIAGNAVTSRQIAGGAVHSVDVRDDNAPNGGLNAPDLNPNSVGTSEVGDGSLTGIDVQNGSIGVADLAPPAYGARASGLVAGGQLTRSENVASVSHPNVGIYCIALELASGINPNTAVLLVGRDSATFPSDQDFSLVQWRSSGVDCPAGRLEVDTFVYNGDDIDDDDGGGNTQGDVLFASDQDFTFVIP
jgi:hypothetical protein